VSVRTVSKRVLLRRSRVAFPIPSSGIITRYTPKLNHHWLGLAAVNLAMSPLSVLSNSEIVVAFGLGVEFSTLAGKITSQSR
jgi:hypothetical protein